MILHKTLECPICGIVQKAELYSQSDNLQNAVVENIMFSICRHFIFEKRMIREVVTGKSHPKEKSTYEIKKGIYPPLGRLYNSTNYHSGMGTIVPESTWIWYYESCIATDYVLTADETMKLYSIQKVLT